jgi:hypothetical protein
VIRTESITGGVTVSTVTPLVGNQVEVILAVEVLEISEEAEAADVSSVKMSVMPSMMDPKRCLLRRRSWVAMVNDTSAAEGNLASRSERKLEATLAEKLEISPTRVRELNTMDL